MDRRQKKTRAQIFTALGHLLEKKHFNHITVQEIIDEADIGRSTFYAHFETKEALLTEMCTDIFEHIFSDHLHCEESHDFTSAESSLENQIVHLLYHLRDNRYGILSILKSDSKDLFMGYFKEYLRDMFVQHQDIFEEPQNSEIKNSNIKNRTTAVQKQNTSLNDVKAFHINFLVGSTAESILWWINQDLKMQPEELGTYIFVRLSVPSELIFQPNNTPGTDKQTKMNVPTATPAGSGTPGTHKQTKMTVPTSACLLGVNCRYSAVAKADERVLELMKRDDIQLIPICPEQLGGLATPRLASERKGDRVVNKAGEDMTAAFEKGAEEALKLAKLYQCDTAILKERSPSCGCGEIYDGTFSKTIIPGNGVTAELFLKNGIRVLGESKLELLQQKQ